MVHSTLLPPSLSFANTYTGGGYCVPAGPDMFVFMFQIVSLLASQGKSVSVLMLSYDLGPTAKYPRQLQQAAALLNHVLSPTGLSYSPSNIVLSGDSAGANLALSLLSHISHPHPSTELPIPKVSLPQGAKFPGVVLISPWVSFGVTDPSFKTNAYKDCIGVSAGTAWSSAWLGEPWPHTKTSDYYNEAVNAPPSWWKDTPVEQVLIVAAGEEVLVDGITKFGKKLIEGMGADKVELCIVPGEYHDQPSIDLQFGYTEADEGQQAKKIKSWISSKL
jgi:acetyl esterase/lipase